MSKKFNLGLLLLLELLEADPKKRKQASECLEHSFFTPVPSDMKKISGTTELIADKLLR